MVRWKSAHVWLCIYIPHSFYYGDAQNNSSARRHFLLGTAKITVWPWKCLRTYVVVVHILEAIMRTARLVYWFFTSRIHGMGSTWYLYCSSVYIRTWCLLVERSLYIHCLSLFLPPKGEAFPELKRDPEMVSLSPLTYMYICPSQLGYNTFVSEHVYIKYYSHYMYVVCETHVML